MSDELLQEAARLGVEVSHIPNDVIPVPAGGVTISKSADIIFRLAGEKRRMFMRGGVVHEVKNRGDDILVPVTPERFCSIVEKLGRRVARRETQNKKIVWRSTTFPKTSAAQALAADEARIHLPDIRFLANCPILTPGGEILANGFHDFNGGTYISGGEMPVEMELDDAVKVLQGMLADFDFASDGDASRAVASLISPALKMGGHIDDDFPMDFAEADQSQSGKNYRLKLVCAVYREDASTITQSRGGVGSLDESIAAALIRGRPFINIGNFRGMLASEIMEEALRGNRFVHCRTLRHAAEVDTSAYLWQFSTNGAELTRDMANRAIITRIRKRPDDHEYQRFAAGDMLAHVKAHQPVFLGAVFRVIREWMDAGCPTTNESRHDFRGWVRVLDWIVQNVLDHAPLLDGHQQEQQRTANPKLTWLRNIIVAIIEEGYDGGELTASDIGEFAESHDIPLPGRRDYSEGIETRVGRVLGQIFKAADAEEVAIDGHTFTRHKKPDYNPVNRTTREVKTYTIKSA